MNYSCSFAWNWLSYFIYYIYFKNICLFKNREIKVAIKSGLFPDLEIGNIFSK